MKALLLAALVSAAHALTVAVTHAAGRMGVSVVGQLRESFSQKAEGEVAPDLNIRAIVSSVEEASRLKLDLCGAVIRDGEFQPLLDLQADLGVELFIVPDDANEQDGLAQAFEGTAVAVLLSAAHADFTPASAESTLQDKLQLDPTDLVPGQTFLKRASAAYDAAALASDATGINVRVPPVAGAAAARRLAAEISAVARTPTMQNVLLRSSMGVGALRGATSEAASEYTQELAAAAVTRMGGAAAIAAQADAEEALRTRCDQRGVSCTVLRLGALVDTAGGIPLSFGCADAQLIERCTDEAAREPPLISRNDAARLVVEIVRRGWPRLDGATVDAAWADKWGLTSAGTEEAARTAGRQDLVASAFGATAAAQVFQASA